MQANRWKSRGSGRRTSLAIRICLQYQQMPSPGGKSFLNAVGCRTSQFIVSSDFVCCRTCGLGANKIHYHEGYSRVPVSVEVTSRKLLWHEITQVCSLKWLLANRFFHLMSNKLSCRHIPCPETSAMEVHCWARKIRNQITKLGPPRSRTSSTSGMNSGSHQDWTNDFINQKLF